MSFREKSAWFVAVGLSVTFGVLFSAMAAGWVRTQGMRSLHYLLMAATSFVLLQVVLHVVARLQDPLASRVPADERERLIALKAARNSGLVLAAGVLMTPASLHLTHVNAPQMGFILVAALLVSEFSRAVSKIVYYRQDR